MPDYKSVYYHLAGRMATAVDVLDTTTEILENSSKSLSELSARLKKAQQTTEEMFLNSDDPIIEIVNSKNDDDSSPHK